MENPMEKRSSQREDLVQQSITIERWQKGAENQRLLVQGIDISSKGLGVLLFQPLRKNDIVKIEYPVADSVKLPVFAEVVWSNELGDSTRVGFRFLR